MFSRFCFCLLFEGVVFFFILVKRSFITKKEPIYKGAYRRKLSSKNWKQNIGNNIHKRTGLTITSYKTFFEMFHALHKILSQDYVHSFSRRTLYPALIWGHCVLQQFIHSFSERTLYLNNTLIWGRCLPHFCIEWDFLCYVDSIQLTLSQREKSTEKEIK